MNIYGKRFLETRLLTLILAFSAVSLLAAPTALQLVTAPDSSQTPCDTAGGDSGVPILSADGRYVLFASTAHNLVVTNNSAPAPLLPQFNVFLRDRTTGVTTLASVNVSGTGGGNGHSFPVDLSNNGRYALIESLASDLVSDDTNEVSDIFVRDLLGGATTLISVSTNGGAGNGVSKMAAMTPDGRYVAFVSAAANLVPNDINGIPDVFVRDVQAGVTTLASVGAKFATEASSSEVPEITPDGRYVVFSSTATNLVAGVTSIGGIYVRDLVAGVTEWASSAAAPALLEAQGISTVTCYNHLISADGNYVAYEASQNIPGGSGAGLVLRYCRGTGLTDLVSTNAEPGGVFFDETRMLDMTPDGQFIAFTGNIGLVPKTTCINLWNASLNTNTVVSCEVTGALPTQGICENPRLDASGRFVAFLSETPNLVTNSIVPGIHLYVRDMQSGTTRLVNADVQNVGSTEVFASSPLSGDGGTIAFACGDGRLVPNDRNRCHDVFLRDMSTNVAELISIRHPTLPCLSPNSYSASSDLSINADGRYIAFSSPASNFAANDTNDNRDIFVCDLQGGTNVLVSVASDGVTCANGACNDAIISPDGRYVAFSSWASNLASGDGNNSQDVFVRDLQSGTTKLVSVNSSGTGSGDKPSTPVSISRGGRFVLFSSTAKNLATVYGVTNYFVRDLVAAKTYVVSTDGRNSLCSMTPDGRFVGILDSSSYDSSFYLWDSQSGTRVYSQTITSPASSFALSRDGNLIVLSAATTIWSIDRAVNAQKTIISGLITTAQELRISPDNRYLLYTSRQSAAGAVQVFLYDFQTQTTQLVSKSPSGAAGNAWSGNPSFGFGSRLIAYRSLATNLVANATNGVRNIFLYDQQTGTTTLLSTTRSNAAVSGTCLNPIFSGDGRTLIFQSWDPDLTALDSNQNCDLFAYTLLCAGISPQTSPGEGNRLDWLMVPGRTARIQYKNSLTEPGWSELSGSISAQGNRHSFLDSVGGSQQRFYRVVAE